MPAAYVLPNVQTTSKLLNDLLGRPVEVKAAAKWMPAANTPLEVAMYITDAKKLTSVCIADLAISGSLGAALAMVPPATVQEGVKVGKLPDNLHDNFKEVLNIGAGPFNVPGATHTKLHNLYHAPTLPNDLMALNNSPAPRLDLEVNVQGYGKGRITFLAIVQR